MRLVTTRNQDDCGVCAIAMVLDQPYEWAYALYGNLIPISEITMSGVPNVHGWWTLQKYWRRYDGPFAERHLVFLMNPAGGPGHYVAMEADGTVLDSARGILPDFGGFKVVWVMGMRKAAYETKEPF